jgi:hypothetical protein
MDYFAVIAFLVIYYVRPHEWIAGVSMLRPVTLTVALGLFALFTRESGLRLKDVLKTPHDYLLLLHFFWMAYASPPFFSTVGETYSLFVFYIMIVQTLTNFERIRQFLVWWATAIFIIAFLAVASEFGFDPMGGHYLVHNTRLEGRLILNTSLFDNPNALGHSVVPLLGMIYLLQVWRKGAVSFNGAFGTSIIPLYCIYLTQSKGSYISAFVSFITTINFKKPLFVQAFTIVAALTLGIAGMKMLPRMGDLGRGPEDREEGIQGRVMAWQYSMQCLESGTLLGYKQFIGSFYSIYGYPKASHSSYIQIGGELGYPGLCLFVSSLYLCFRTLTKAQTRTVEEERVRRTLFVLLFSFVTSSWMVDFAYRATFFMIVGAVAAFHRLYLIPPSQRPDELEDDEDDEDEQIVRVNFGGDAIESEGEKRDPEMKDANFQPIWNRFRVIDIPLFILLTYLTKQFWTFAMNKV